MVGSEDFDFECTLRHLLVEDGLRIEGAVVIANAGVIAADDKVAGAHVLPEVGVQHRFPRPGVEHVETVAGYDRAVFRKVEFHHGANRVVAHLCRNVARLQFAQQHVDDESVAIQPLHRHVAQLFVGQVHRVAGLEGDHAFPAALLDFVSDLHRGAEGVGEIGLEIAEVKYLYRSADGIAAVAVEGRDARVLVIERAINLLRHQCHLVVADGFDVVDLLDCNNRIAVDVRIAQRDARRAFDLRNRFHQVQDRHREEAAVGQVHVIGARKRIGHVHVTLQRGEVTPAEHHRVGGRGGADFHRGQLRGFFDKRVALAVVVNVERGEVVCTDGIYHGDSRVY